MAYTRADYQRAVEVIRSRTQQAVNVGLVLGSGMGVLADQLENRTVIPYEDIPGWPLSTVHGHAGQLVIGTLEGCRVVTQQGRAHFYEGYTMQQVTFPIRVMRELGVTTLILTNAAGGVNREYRVGDVMMLSDHINFVGMAGNSPLVGPNDDSLGDRFIGMAHAYDSALRECTRQVARDAGLTLHEGVYVCVAGPSFETPAEVRMLRTLGVDAVGMSTVHEVLVARHGGMRALAFSGITNQSIDVLDSASETNHEEVLEAGAILIPKLTTLLRGVVRTLA
jgi:purine-nucleoside phosphorylase